MTEEKILEWLIEELGDEGLVLFNDGDGYIVMEGTPKDMEYEYISEIITEDWMLRYFDFDMYISDLECSDATYYEKDGYTLKIYNY